MEMSSEQLKRLYQSRFDEETAQRDAVWKVLCSRFFQHWIPEESTVLDLAAGHCEFINNIAARRRIAVDLNPDVVQRAAEGVETVVARSDELAAIDDQSIDRVFISNFFEHISRDAILSTLIEIRRVLRSDGRLLLLQPNIRFVGNEYWQFFDHITAVDDRAMVEAFEQTGYTVVKNIPRFLPFTTKGKLPSGPALVRMYLKFPLAWRLLGGQAFMVAKPIA